MKRILCTRVTAIPYLLRSARCDVSLNLAGCDVIREAIKTKIMMRCYDLTAHHQDLSMDTDIVGQGA
jgi:hypothetical protein